MYWDESRTEHVFALCTIYYHGEEKSVLVSRSMWPLVNQQWVIMIRMNEIYGNDMMKASGGFFILFKTPM